MPPSQLMPFQPAATPHFFMRCRACDVDAITLIYFIDFHCRQPFSRALRVSILQVIFSYFMMPIRRYFH